MTSHWHHLRAGDCDEELPRREFKQGQELYRLVVLVLVLSMVVLLVVEVEGLLVSPLLPVVPEFPLVVEEVTG